MSVPPESEFAAAIGAHAALAGTGVVKVIVSPHGGMGSEASRLSVRAEPPRQRPLHWWRDGVEIITCRTRLAAEPKLAGLKLLARSAQELARREWTTEAVAEGLMLDPDGRLISGTMTNVYAVIDGVICTPAITRCGVAGVTRAGLLEAWQADAQSTLIVDLDPAEIKSASEIFLSNALIGVWPVRMLDGHAFAVGPVACAAQRTCKEL
jgi:4-amino-4-deoxychorismate lyase